jgi:hypothetical protein
MPNMPIFAAQLDKVGMFGDNEKTPSHYYTDTSGEVFQIGRQRKRGHAWTTG